MVVVKIPDLHIAGGKNDVGLAQRAHNVHGADLPRFQLQRIHVELNLAPGSAEGLWNRRSGYACQLIANKVLRDVLQVAVRHSFAVHGHQTNGQAGRVRFENHRRQSTGGQILHIRDRKIGNGGRVNIGVGVGLKIDANDADSAQGNATRYGRCRWRE